MNRLFVLLVLSCIFSACISSEETEQNTERRDLRNLSSTTFIPVTLKKTTTTAITNEDLERPSLGDSLFNMTELISSGEPFYCEYVQDNARIQTHIWGDMFHSRIDMGNVVVHSLNDAETVYYWVEGSDTGTSFSVENYEGDEDGGAIDFTNLDEITEKSEEITCVTTKLDKVLFIPPNDIKFTDLDAMMGFI